jgi:hypothetical protein
MRTLTLLAFLPHRRKMYEYEYEHVSYLFAMEILVAVAVAVCFVALSFLYRCVCAVSAYICFLKNNISMLQV